MTADKPPSAGRAKNVPASGAAGKAWPAGTTAEDRRCWICGGVTEYRHCKIICTRCGFVRDCSDP